MLVPVEPGRSFRSNLGARSDAPGRSGAVGFPPLLGGPGLRHGLGRDTDLDGHDRVGEVAAKSAPTGST